MTKCDHCQKIATYTVWGDFYTGDTLVGYVCVDHALSATERTDCHHLEPRSLEDYLNDLAEWLLEKREQI